MKDLKDLRKELESCTQSAAIRDKVKRYVAQLMAENICSQEFRELVAKTNSTEKLLIYLKEFSKENVQ